MTHASDVLALERCAEATGLVPEGVGLDSKVEKVLEVPLLRHHRTNPTITATQSAMRVIGVKVLLGDVGRDSGCDVS